MSMCSYSCNICNGGKWRCGTGNKNCGCKGYGSKYCWEQEVVLELKTDKNPIIVKGVYDGYGRLHVSDKYKNLGKNIYWENYDLFTYAEEIYDCKNENKYKQFCVDIVFQGKTIDNPDLNIFCKSCYNKNKNKN